VEARDETRPDTVFTGRGAGFNRLNAVVPLCGWYLSAGQLLEAQGVLTQVERYGLAAVPGYTWAAVRHLRESVRGTRWVLALNAGRVWARTRLVERLSPLVAEDVAVAVVPSHDPFLMEPPIRLLAQALAGERARTDATGCLVRHTKINRIVYGGRSDRQLHRATIRVVMPEVVAGKRVLLLDDIARSGASLRACRELLYEAGATRVQAAALGEVVSATGPSL